ncbi:SUKH-4 family immunity protein [Streptomyces beijiangensis]|uniref:SUKH-4 family immunity protein n=1 Tax=Streptomyces beijiangensis TaxID=163361 RepID=A0A939JFV9_9ACTN|nr:SUKH-4 family immunity protein [Streptomyces beijiangensis]MBO0514546.1 SUKH-4 family immunity protein [Streptomyces beijiangensis]
MPEDVLAHEFNEALDMLSVWAMGSSEEFGNYFLDGTTGSGKTRLIQDAARRVEGALLIDCSELSASELAHQVMRALKIEYGPFLDNYDLCYEMSERRSNRVVLLTNTQWAGSVRTTAEPQRVLTDVVGVLASEYRSTGVRFAAEMDHSVARAWAGAPTVVMAPPAERIDRAGLPLEPRQRAAVEALALAEPRAVRFEEWSAVCDALGHNVTEDELHGLALETALITVDEAHEYPVRFKSESTAHHIRQAVSPDVFRAFQHAMVRRLSDGSNGERLAAYAARALPAHAAAAGCFEELLGDVRAVVRCERYALLEGLDAAFPHSIPAGTRAAELHYLAKLPVSLASQADWLSLLHHSAVCRGDAERAEALETAAGALPWTTVWANARPAGTLLENRVWTGGIDQLRTTPDGTQVISTNDDGTELSWEARTGRVCSGREPKAPEDEAGDAASSPLWRAERAWNRVHIERADDPDVARILPAPRARDALAVGDLIVIGGPVGLYAVKAGTQAGSTQLRTLPRILRSGRITPRPFDERHRHPSRAELSSLFGAAHVHTLGKEQLPAGLTHLDTREFLSNTGLPAVEDFYGLDTENLNESELTEVPWEGAREYETSIGDGPFYRLGTWIDGTLLLDGATGRILRQTTAEAPDSDQPGDPLVGTTLSGFTAMVALHWRYMLAYTQSDGTDSEDLLAELRSWLAEIDSAAAASRSWQHVLDPDNFSYL